MGYDFSRLPDDFATLQGPIREKIQKYCGGLHYKQTGLRWGHGIFSVLSDDESAKRLANFIDPQLPDGINSWLSYRWWLLFIICIAVVLMLAFCALAIFGSKRGGKTSLAFKPFFRKGSANNGKMVMKGSSATLFRLAIMACCCFGTFAAIFSIIGGAQMNKGISESECAFWLGAYGHYFGSTNITAGPRQEIATGRWGGTVPMRRTLSASTSPVAQKIIQSRAAVGQLLTANTVGMIDDIKAMIPFTTSFASIYQQSQVYAAKTYLQATGVTNEGTKTKATEIEAWVQPVYNSFLPFVQQDVQVNLYQHGLVDLLGEIDTLLDKYLLAPTDPAEEGLSPILKSTDSLEVINNIDTSLFHLVTKWTNLAGMLRGIIFTMNIIAYVLLPLLILAVGLSTWKVFSRVPGATKSRVLDWSYITMLVSGGILLVLAGGYLMVASIGSDVCVVGENDLFQENRWHLLGDQVVNVGDDETRIKAIYDVCISKHGDGDVVSASRLGIRTEEILSNVDYLLNKLGDPGFDQLALTGNSWKPSTNYFCSEQIERATVSLEEYSYILEQAFNRTYWGYRQSPGLKFQLPQIDDVDEVVTEGLYTLGQLKPASLSALLTFVYSGVFMQYTNYDTFINTINEFSDYHNILEGKYTAEESPVPKAARKYSVPTLSGRRLQETTESPTLPFYCGELAKVKGSWCADLPTPAENSKWSLWNLSAPYNHADLRALYTGLTTTAWPEGGYRAREELPARMAQSVITATMYDHFYRFNNWSEIETQLPEGVCSNDATCTLNEARLQALEIVQQHIASLKAKQAQNIGAFMSYVYSLIVPVLQHISASTQELGEYANCQFQGTSIRGGVFPALCEVLFSGAAFTSILCLITAIVFLYTAYVVRFWQHALALEGDDDICPPPADPVTDTVQAQTEKFEEGLPSENHLSPLAQNLAASFGTRDTSYVEVTVVESPSP